MSIMFNLEEKFVPFSARRYSVTIKGEIYSHENNQKTELIPTPTEHGEVVRLSWLFGCKDYSLALVILISFERIKLPDHLYDQVEILYVDGNQNNNTLKNLIYRFKKPLEVEGYPGFFYIPFYTEYGISRNGEIKNIYTGKEKVWSITKDPRNKNMKGGYYYSRVLTCDGFSKCLFLHRALAFTFLPYGNDVQSLTVNHKDGNGSNNDIKNLEWCTYRENNIHAVEIGLRPNSASPIVMKDTVTDEEKVFPSMVGCARYLHGNDERKVENTRRMIQKLTSTGKLLFDRYKLRYKDKAEWIDETKVNPRSIIAKNIFSDDIIIFDDIKEGSNLTKVPSSAILRHVRNNLNVPYKGWNFREFTGKAEWPEHSSRHMEIYKRYTDFPSDGLIEIDTETGEEKFYASLGDACYSLKMTRERLNEIINHNVLYKGKYKYKVFDIKKEYV